MQGQLTFGEDCIIKLQDLGDFKDYSETLENLKNSLEYFKGGNFDAINDLWEIINSDPEDTYFLPDFQKVLSLMSGINWRSYVNSKQFLKIIGFYLQIIEQALISYTFGQQIVQNLIKEVLKQNEDIAIQPLLLKLLFRLSDKVIYIEQFQKIILFWNMVCEDKLVKQYQNDKIDKIMAVYVECCQKFLRNKQVRKLLVYDENRTFLTLKICLWNGDIKGFQQYAQKLNKKQFYGSLFLKQMCRYLQKQFKPS